MTYEALNMDLGNDIIILHPETEGTLKWVTSKRLVFEPKDRWKLRQHYSVKIELDRACKLDTGLSAVIKRLGYPDPRRSPGRRRLHHFRR